LGLRTQHLQPAAPQRLPEFFHRPCFFPIIVADAKGKERKRYPYESLMTAYEKLKSLAKAQAALKADVSPHCGGSTWDLDSIGYPRPRDVRHWRSKIETL
jgi:hypothetical protein